MVREYVEVKLGKPIIPLIVIDFFLFFWTLGIRCKPLPLTEIGLRCVLKPCWCFPLCVPTLSVSLNAFDGIGNLFPSSLLCSLSLSLWAVNVDKVDELIKSITAGAEAERDTAVQRTGSEKKSHRGTGEQLTDGQRVVMDNVRKNRDKEVATAIQWLVCQFTVHYFTEPWGKQRKLAKNKC